MEINEKRSVYSLVTDKILEQLHKGVVPWKQPWGEAPIPQNFITKRPYRGINLLLLGMLPYPTNYFLTFEQSKSIDATIKKGERAHLVVFWKRVLKQRAENEAQPEQELSEYKAVLRYYKVFNIAQCNGIPEDKIPTMQTLGSNGAIETCEKVLSEIPNSPRIEHGHKGAYYFPDTDVITMLDKDWFTSLESYYDTLFHELVHSTGHPKRLNRPSLTEKASMGSQVYSYEELIAEIGACFLTSHCGVQDTVFENNVAYIAGWVSKLQSNTRWIVSAAAQAQQAVDHLLNVSYENKD